MSVAESNGKFCAGNQETLVADTLVDSSQKTPNPEEYLTDAQPDRDAALDAPTPPPLEPKAPEPIVEDGKPPATPVGAVTVPGPTPEDNESELGDSASVVAAEGRSGGGRDPMYFKFFGWYIFYSYRWCPIHPWKNTQGCEGISRQKPMVNLNALPSLWSSGELLKDVTGLIYTADGKILHHLKTQK